ncbi:putative ankyrin-3-like isoform X2 [Penaeus vannamei]|uniref:Putative ankyrin-3-like isoform X2 n=1 Tax=Penaeus vannamei TaxID=6689 RepID=A0A3R7Q517_PENVA|nr:putative ankyrin-3-like isoform X2 [Penaeus vannamei]
MQLTDVVVQHCTTLLSGTHFSCGRTCKMRSRLADLSDAGKSVLHYASFYGRLEVVQRLVIEHPDLITFRDKLELSAEDTADIRGQVHSAWWLRKQAKRDATYKGKDAGVLASSVDFGLCEIHFQDQQGWTLLHAAAEQNNLPIIRILLERGALPTALTFNGKTPSDLAREKGHLQAYNMIISNYICETKGSPEELFVALLSLITETAYYNAYAATTPHDLESTDASPKGQNPSLSAVRKASSLLTSGAPLEPPGSHTCYPLHLAITANCTPLLPLLLAAGAPLTATRDGLGPVQLAWLTPDITTWVAVLVTRAVRDRIAMEMQPLDDALQAAARALLEALDGERPWEAALERPAGSSDSLDALLFRAARGGPPLWPGGSGTAAAPRCPATTRTHAPARCPGRRASRHGQSPRPPHGGNLFLPDTDGRLPISLMSSEIIQESLAREYTILEQEKEKAKNSASCREVFEEALLLLVLCLEFNPHVNSPDNPDERWRTVLAWVLSVHGNGSLHENNLDPLLKSAMIKACEKDMPLFLHLLTCVAGANVSEKIDEVCGGFPLHYAALHNNMSAARYILSQGASPSVQDRFGNTPAHYAYMFGHQEVGDFLKTDIKNNNGLPAESRLKGLVNCEPEDRRLAIVLPGVKKTQVGVSLSLVWTGEVFPLLLVDVDVVATARASWPPALRRPKLTPSTLDSVYLNSIGNNEWRFSFALAENAVMKSLTADKRRVFLACKMVLSALKVEKWAPRHVQNQFKYFHGRFFKIPSPKGFLLKNTFFLELEEVTDEEQWTEEHLVERMTSVFRRMCEEHTDPASQETSWEPAAVKAYFADLTESPCVGFGVPEILNFLKSLDSQLNQFQLQSNRKRRRSPCEYNSRKRYKKTKHLQ